MNKKINAMYFSATGTTKKIVSALAEKISKNIDDEAIINYIDFTLPEVRKKSVSFTEEDVVIIGVPVYAGRVPNVLLKYLNAITGNGALAVPIVVYGNRNYDDALIELKDILELNGFKAIAGGAFIGEHSFSKILAKDRPDEKDIAIVIDFADKIYKKIILKDEIQTVEVKGNKPYRKYYMPKDEKGRPVDIRKVKPKTNNNCIDCKLCVNICPMGSIDAEDVSKFNGICIKCGACIKKCPVQAKYYDDKDYLRHKQELEIDFVHRREPELFI
ncbi:ferredoxin [Crassaminicella thermophila]|uniref:Ferredoxin n=1 Tax=Crassaminicella thermophila TaxID=2599308 RepID=A0A5C0SCR6_CRATE|nr:EFR1 family ferrodoxin [Crassaminicella thermophila]QEK11737.1 ferredoxin [Crassaminicella thermophila]